MLSFVPFEHEVAEEKAAGLARTEQRLLAALDAYRRAATGRGAGTRDGERREHVLWDLVEVVTSYVVQREACGLRDSRHVYELYEVPPEIVRRIGVRRPLRS